jgi:hypothetical protein
MKFLIDTSKKTLIEKQEKYNLLVAGQLLTPLTRYKNAGGVFAIDNGSFSGFNSKPFKSLLKRDEDYRSNCLFVAVPDIVGSARRTLEIWNYRHEFINTEWPLALVIQDGMEDLEIPWDNLAAVFLGGCDPWKDSKAAMDIIKTAKVLNKIAHIGRVNTIKRFARFAEIGADTCDGSGVAMYDHMLDDIARELRKEPEPMLFEKDEYED